jgi:hypothetical protein
VLDGGDEVGHGREAAAAQRLPGDDRKEGLDEVEWQVSDRRYLSEASMALLTPPEPTAIDTRRTDVSEVIDQPALQTA